MENLQHNEIKINIYLHRLRLGTKWKIEIRQCNFNYIVAFYWIRGFNGRIFEFINFGSN